ncbi:MAG TPA: Wzz/FepE/Etk N-terminal domain-containing protein, partial [Petrotogaceae bacterium]|nr:Wzz/FepE/Etk N-terminal domain-containing protein [Petrotogaceae bacterium]
MVREADYSIKDVLYIFKRRKMVFLLVFAAVMAGVFLFLFMAPKKYEAFMILQYNNAEDSGGDVSSSLASLFGSGGKSGENGIPNEIQKMKSDDILGILVDKYDLVNSTNNSPSLYMRLIGKKVNKRDMIDSMKKDIVITYHRPDDIVENTSLLRISYKSSDRNFAYSVVKTLYEEYLKKDLIGYQKKSQDNIEKIYALYSQYSSEYEDISKQIIKFRMDNKISSDPSS